VSEIDPEDQKLITLARSARARTRAAEGAAVRDRDGRTYVAATVALPSLSLSALQVAVAMAVSSGALGLEAAAIVTTSGAAIDADAAAAADPGLAALRELAPSAPLIVAAADGARPA
jgi:hypothetical protein